MGAMASGEDEWARLLRAANAGDGAAYAAFLRAVAPRIRGLVRSRAGSLGPETCEDIVQETLLAIHLKRHTWREDAPVAPWLWAIARHKAVDAFRARGLRATLPLEAGEEVAAEPGPDATAPHDVGRLLARLEPRAAAVVRAVALEEGGAAEVGARLGLSEGAVRVALHRAMGRLRALAGTVPGDGR